eukprot:scaffold329076_cov45-Prasinocladus_malaysianus.AAC.2
MELPSTGGHLNATQYVIMNPDCQKSIMYEYSYRFRTESLFVLYSYSYEKEYGHEHTESNTDESQSVLVRVRYYKCRYNVIWCTFSLGYGTRTRYEYS